MANADIRAWANSIRNEVTRMKGQTPGTVTIPRVPERLRRGENDAYEPRIISFGPYHRGKPRLLAMEKYKWRFLDGILSRNPEIPMEDYISMIKEQEEKIRNCYSDSFDIDSSEDFVKMMLIDSCFIVGYFLQFPSDVCEELDSMVWAHGLIQYDILLLENQLPFFILDGIFDMAITQSSSMQDCHSFTDLAIRYLKRIPSVKVNLPPPADSVHHHLLHLYHSFCLYTPEGKEESGTEIINVDSEDDKGEQERLKEYYYDSNIPSATVLKEAGIIFMRKEVGGCCLDVTFSMGKLMIRPLFIDFSTKSKYRNLIAFEQFYPNFFDRKLYSSFTTYAAFMDRIVNTTEDVALLYEKGIIPNLTGSNEDIVNFLNHLPGGTFWNPDLSFYPLYKKINKYMAKRRHKWRASLMHNYFKSPWAVLGIVTGGILLILTFLQTYFSGLSAF